MPPPTAEPYRRGDPGTVAWDDAVAALSQAATYWLATQHPAGRPHVAPVLAVWADGALHFAAGPDTRKARNLATHPTATVSADAGRLHLVVEGATRRVTDPDSLRRIAEAYVTAYGWEVVVAGGAFHGEGAPTAGPGPYDVYELAPRVAFGFPVDGSLPPTRWRFR